MNDFLLSTTHILDGYIVEEYLDIIFEESIFGVSFKTGMKGFKDMFKGLTGERFNAISDRIAEIKINIKDKLVEQAKNLGANAIIGVDIETTRNINDGTIGISMSGTAVIIKKKKS